jgi:hypothetical protein
MNRSTSSAFVKFVHCPLTSAQRCQRPERSLTWTHFTLDVTVKFLSGS